MTITNITPRETELQKQVIQLAESLRNLGWEFELYKTGARSTHQKLLDEIRELRAKLAEVWQEGYDRGVDDECISQDNIGIAGFGAKVNPARANPYLKGTPTVAYGKCKHDAGGTSEAVLTTVQSVLSEARSKIE